MAKKQTRRSVSLNRSNYEAAKLEAEHRGVTLAALIEAGLAAIGVPVVAHPQQTRALAQTSAARRAESVGTRNKAQAQPRRPSRERTVATRNKAQDQPRRPSRERQVLGDYAADAYGFA